MSLHARIHWAVHWTGSGSCDSYCVDVGVQPNGLLDGLWHSLSLFCIVLSKGWHLMTKKPLSGKDLPSERERSVYSPMLKPLVNIPGHTEGEKQYIFLKVSTFISCWSHCIWKYFRTPWSPCPLPDTPHHADRKQPLVSSPLIPQHSSRNHVPSGGLKYIWISLKSSGNYASASCDLFPFIATFSEIIQLDILERFGMNQTSQIRGKFVSQGSVQSN